MTKKTRLAIAALAAAGVAVLLVLIPTRAQISATGPLDMVANHYKCYRITEWDNFTPVDHRLTDQFATNHPADVLRPSLLCNPTRKDNGPMPQPTWHLVCYDILVDQDPVEHTVAVKNQYPNAELKTFEPELLCLPSLKDEI